MRRIAISLALGMWGFGTAQGSSFAVEAAERSRVIQIQDMQLALPGGWTLQQDAEDQGTIILGFASGDEYLTFYVRAEADLDMHATFANGSRIERDVFDYPRSSFAWKVMQTSKPSRSATNYMSAFKTDFLGFTYYGYSRAMTAERSLEIINSFLTNIR